VEAAGIEPADRAPRPSHATTGGCESSSEEFLQRRERLAAQLAASGRGEADLGEVIDAWSMLAEPVRAGILAIVRAVRSGGAPR